MWHIGLLLEFVFDFFKKIKTELMYKFKIKIEKAGGNFIISNVQWTEHFNKTGKKVIEEKTKWERKKKADIVTLLKIQVLS